MKPDVVVVGAGLAGLSAAVRLAEAGASVRVLAKGVGSTHLSAGTIDVLGYDADGGRVDRPLEALGRLPAEHPYGLVGRAGVSAAIEWFKGRIAEGARAPYAYVGDGEQNVLLPTSSPPRSACDVGATHRSVACAGGTSPVRITNATPRPPPTRFNI